MLSAIALGANLGNPVATIQSAVNALTQEDGIDVLACSGLYRSAAIGPVRQRDYVNAAVTAEVTLPPLLLLNRLQMLERRYGRTHYTERWGPRTLDLDLITYADQIIENSRLVVPHPEAHHRCFVLAPLAEIEPHLLLPGYGEVVALLVRCDTGTVDKIDMRTAVRD